MLTRSWLRLSCEASDMTLTASQAVQTALQLPAALTDGLASLRQGPRILKDVDVYSMIRAEIKAVGSEAELARRMGITRQSLHAVYNADRAPGPAILTYFRLRKVSGRTTYERI